MKTWLFVDGYNIIGAWPELTQLRDESLEEARKKVIDYLSEYAAATGYETVLVFDGWRVKGNRGSVVENPYIEILFTPEGVTADMAIERLVAGLPKHQKIYVATSDRLEQETVLAQGGLRISAMELHSMVFTQKEAQRARIARQPQSANPLDAQLDEAVRRKLHAMIHGQDEEIEKNSAKNRKKKQKNVDFTGSPWYYISRRLDGNKQHQLTSLWRDTQVGQRGRTVNPLAVLSQVRILFPPLPFRVVANVAGWSSWQLVGLITRRSQVQVLSPQFLLI